MMLRRMGESGKVVCVVLVCIIIAVGSVEGNTWCLAKGRIDPVALQSGLDFACSHGADCGPILPGGSCFIPNTLLNHASYAFNSYYQKTGKAPGSCNFAGAATIAVKDPSMRFLFSLLSTHQNLYHSLTLLFPFHLYLQVLDPVGTHLFEGNIYNFMLFSFFFYHSFYCISIIITNLIFSPF